jgi:uncharacterized OB-fold protein
MQRCSGCGSYIFYPRVICPQCSSQDLEWRPLSGRAKLYTYTVTEPGKGSRGGEILAIVELEEGPRLASTLMGLDPDLVQIGMPLDPVFDNETFDDVTLLRFRPASAGS